MSTRGDMRVHKLTQLMLSGQYAILIDETSTRDVSPEARQELNAIKEILKNMKALTPGSEIIINDLLNRLSLIFINNEDFLNGDNKISNMENIFLIEVIEVADALHGMIRVLSDGSIEMIKSILLKLSDLNTYARMSDMTIENVFQEKNSTSKFLVDTLRKTKITFDSLFGIDSTIEKIKEALDGYENPLTTRPAFIMLTGPPGTGKSTIAKASATKFSNGQYINWGNGELSSGTVGDAESGIMDVFDHYKKNGEKIVIILDEFDVILTDTTNHMRSVRNVLQTSISGGEQLPKNITLIGISNEYNKITEQFRRRISLVINVDVPPPGQCLNFLMQLWGISTELLNDEFINVINQLLFNDRQKVTNDSILRIHNNAMAKIFNRKHLLYTEEPIYYRKHLLQTNILKEQPVFNMEIEKNVFIPNHSTFMCLPTIDEFKESIKGVPILSLEKYNEFLRSNEVE